MSDVRKVVEEMRNLAVILTDDEQPGVAGRLGAMASILEAAMRNPVAWIISDPDEPEIGSWIDESGPVDGYQCVPLFAAPPDAALIAEECANLVQQRAEFERTDLGRSACMMAANAIRERFGNGE